MSLNKKILAAAIVSGLFSTSAFAQVVISATTPTPVRYAEEIVSSTASPVTLAAIPENRIQTALLYNFSPGEVRHARIECSSHIRIATGAVTSSNVATTIGAINGLGTHAIHFSITAGASPNQSLATDTLTIDGTRSITSTAAGTCAYSLYDQPSQAAAGGDVGRIVTTGSRSYMAVARSFRLAITLPRTSTADVEANPAFTSFVLDSPTTLSTAALATVLFDVPATADQTRLPSGVLISDTATLGNVLGATTAIQVNATSDGFSGVSSSGATPYDAAARARVYLSGGGTGGCVTTSSQIASTLSASTATFAVGSTVPNGPRLLCYERRIGLATPVTDFTTGLNAVAASAAFAPTNIAAVASGNIIRNGTQLQAPLAQVPTGWLSRVVLTNTGSVARPYTITAQTEASVTATMGGAASGSIPANGTVVLSVADIVTFTGTAPRGTLNVTVAGPTGQIQGLYQIVNPASGSISNHVMVRPGTN